MIFLHLNIIYSGQMYITQHDGYKVRIEFSNGAKVPIGILNVNESKSGYNSNQRIER